MRALLLWLTLAGGCGEVARAQSLFVKLPPLLEAHGRLAFGNRTAIADAPLDQQAFLDGRLELGLGPAACELGGRSTFWNWTNVTKPQQLLLHAGVGCGARVEGVTALAGVTVNRYNRLIQRQLYYSAVNVSVRLDRPWLHAFLDQRLATFHANTFVHHTRVGVAPRRGQWSLSLVATRLRPGDPLDPDSIAQFDPFWLVNGVVRLEADWLLVGVGYGEDWQFTGSGKEGEIPREFRALQLELAVVSRF